MDDYNLQLKVRNNYFLARMNECGYQSVSDLADAAGVGANAVYDLINLKRSPYGKSGSPRPSAQKIADKLYASFEDIFPAQHLHNPLERNTAETTVSIGDVQRLTGGDSPESLLESDEMRHAVVDSLSSLPDRHRQVIEGRLGFDGDPKTLNDLAQELGVGRERIRQIESNAYRRLRSPVLADNLRAHNGAD